MRTYGVFFSAEALIISAGRNWKEAKKILSKTNTPEGINMLSPLLSLILCLSQQGSSSLQSRGSLFWPACQLPHPFSILQKTSCKKMSWQKSTLRAHRSEKEAAGRASSKQEKRNSFPLEKRRSWWNSPLPQRQGK